MPRRCRPVRRWRNLHRDVGRLPGGRRSSRRRRLRGSSNSGACDNDAADHCSGSTTRASTSSRRRPSRAAPIPANAMSAETCTGSSGLCRRTRSSRRRRLRWRVAIAALATTTRPITVRGPPRACVDVFQASTFTCRADTGQCDVGETCTGTSGLCPADSVEPATTLCAGASQLGACDNDAADHCSGSTTLCVDVFQPSTFTCRADTGQCDVGETCTGTSGLCPADAVEPATTTCTGASQLGACDNDAADHCTGSTTACIDVFQAATVTCRASTGQCDLAESCTGGRAPARRISRCPTAPPATTTTPKPARMFARQVPARAISRREPLAIDSSLRIGKDPSGSAELIWGDATGTLQRVPRDQRSSRNAVALRPDVPRPRNHVDDRLRFRQTHRPARCTTTSSRG